MREGEPRLFRSLPRVEAFSSGLFANANDDATVEKVDSVVTVVVLCTWGLVVAVDCD